MGYPKKGFGAHEQSIFNKLPEECKAEGKADFVLWEYPIVPLSLYKGGDPGEDRVILAEWNKGTEMTRTYCVTVTHRGNEENIHSICSEVP